MNSPGHYINHHLTPQRRIVFDVLSRAAEHGQPCPSDLEIAAALGIESAGGASRHVGVLVKMRLIRIEAVAQNRRVVTIIATGAATAQPPTVKPARPAPRSSRHSSRRLIVLDRISLCAAEGLPCPSDAELAAEFGSANQNTAQAVLADLRMKGVIAVESPGKRRIVTIIATGARTERIARRPKREPKNTLRTHPDGTSRIETGGNTNSAGRMARVSGGPPIVTAAFQARIYPPATECHFQHSERGSYRACANRVIPGSSYCAEHHAVCWRVHEYPRKRGAA